MGQKVNPHGLRVGIIKPWDTQWYADKKSFGANLKEDNDIRTFIKKKYYDAAISKITIIRAANKVEVGIYTGRPGVLIGKAGAEIEVIKKDLAKRTKGKTPEDENGLRARKLAVQRQLRAFCPGLFSTSSNGEKGDRAAESGCSADCWARPRGYPSAQGCLNRYRPGLISNEEKRSKAQHCRCERK